MFEMFLRFLLSVNSISFFNVSYVLEFAVCFSVVVYLNEVLCPLSFLLIQVLIWHDSVIGSIVYSVLSYQEANTSGYPFFVLLKLLGCSGCHQLDSFIIKFPTQCFQPPLVIIAQILYFIGDFKMIIFYISLPCNLLVRILFSQLW